MIRGRSELNSRIDRNRVEFKVHQGKLARTDNGRIDRNRVEFKVTTLPMKAEEFRV